ncbi:MAG: conjugal transfer protein TrbH [Pseudomonadota bacterium]
MNKVMILAVVAMSLAGCASGPAPTVFGNFVKGTAPADGRTMADDVAKKLTALYPPAQTRINLQQVTPDAFGTTLVVALRTKGYALAEFKKGPIAGAANQAGEIALAYVVDQPMEAGLYRVTVFINSQSLSRLYQAAKDGAISPAGSWVWKE